MKLQFESNQSYQLDAIKAAVDLLTGLGPTSSVPTWSEPREQGHFAVAGCIANQVDLTDEDLLVNLRKVQEVAGLTKSDNLDGRDFSVEMETGTGKTYVYLRTILELNKTYGLTKFVIVVPNVAIKEGVAKSIQITRAHFSSIYGKQLYEARTFSSKRLSEARQFAGSNLLQVLLINIDAFNKAANIINQPNELLGNIRPIDLLASVRPVVILDEPQNMEGDVARSAIARLNPCFTLRYSATHKTKYNLIYRLTPVQAYALRLVKRIEVISVLPERDPGKAFVNLLKIVAKRRGVQVKIEIDAKVGDRVVRRTHSLNGTGQNLFDLSGGLPAYHDLYITGADAAREVIELSNGTIVELERDAGTNDDLMKAQITETVREHLEKELAAVRGFLEGHRPKILSLFFIDRVANYAPREGKIRKWFEAVFEEFRTHPRYAELSLPEAKHVHRGYFSIMRGAAKDTSGASAADEDTYALIMREKERLLSRSEPVRYIFSHSALREGWDNPNVFQICTLNETRSEIKKRQEIGRGMRLPVDESGQRIRLPAVNFLTVVANESYETFARKLQTEIEEESGVPFTHVIPNRRARRSIGLVNGWSQDTNFRSLWDAIAGVSILTCTLDTASLISRAAMLIGTSPQINAPRIIARRASVEIADTGVEGKLLVERSSGLRRERARLPNPLEWLQRRVGLSRSTLHDMLVGSGRLSDFLKNSDQFLQQSLSAIESALTEELVKGASYAPVANQKIDSQLFLKQIVEAYDDRLVPVTKSITTHIEAESATEVAFVKALEARQDVPLYLKLPSWFAVPTPAGDYWPDWGIVKVENGQKSLYLVRETKSSWDPQQLRGKEVAKISCAARHFASIGAAFGVVTSATQI